MIRIIGYINGRFVCDVVPDTAANQKLIKLAIRCGLSGAIMRV